MLNFEGFVRYCRMNVTKIIGKYAYSILAISIIISFSQCKTGYGCPANENLKAGVDKKGNLTNKKGKSSLFPKKQMKKVGVKE